MCSAQRMAAGRQSKSGTFAIPSLEEMKQAGKTPPEGGGPMIFKSKTSTDQRRGTVGQISAPETGKPHPLPQRPTKGRMTSSGSVGERGGGSYGHEVEEGMEEQLEKSSEAANIRLRVDTATTTCLGGVARGEGSSGEGAVMATPMTVETSSGLALTRHHHPHAIITNPVQKRNPVMKHIRNVPWEVGDIVPDFVLGATTCALFLSVKYHSLHPDYIHSRLKDLGKQFELRVLLVLVDMTECQKVLHELARIAILANLTLLVAWSYEEAGRYLETYKAYENKPPDLLMERVEGDFTSQITEALTTVKKVNKTDAATLLNTYKAMEGIITASKEELTLCPGLGQQKAQRLYDLFHEPFVRQKRPGH